MKLLVAFLSAAILLTGCDDSKEPSPEINLVKGTVAYTVRDYKSALPYLLDAAKHGSATAQGNLGTIYTEGFGVPKNTLKAYMWLDISISNGGDAQGVKDELAKGMTKGEISIAQYMAKSCLNSNYDNCDVPTEKLASLRKNEKVVKKSTETSLELYKKAAEKGDAEAQFKIGVMYDNGDGVPQDFKQAMVWYKKAAVQGNVNAQYNIGVLYNLGQGVSKNYIETMSWYRRAAEQGDTRAQFNVGLLYKNGHGVLQSNINSYMWVNLSIFTDSGKNKAKKESVLNELSKNMTQEEVAMSQKMSLMCLKSNYKQCGN